MNIVESGGRYSGVWVLALICLLISPAALPQETIDADGDQSVDDTARWAFEFFDEAIQQGRAAGMVFSVSDVNGHAISRGVGLADPKTARPVDADETKFLIASATKPFAAIVILQLLDSGLIRSLDEPANSYLKRVAIPSLGERAVTIRDLLTHRNGLDLRGRGILSDIRLEVPASAEHVQSMLPSPVRAPGKDVVYSNSGFALLGVLAEDVTGKTLQRLMRDGIFAPLGMAKSELSYNPEPDDSLARSYYISDGAVVGEPRFDANTPYFAPAGSIRTTGENMARFMTEVLRAANDMDNKLLSPQTRKLMFERNTGHGEGLPGIGLSFFLETWNDALVALHPGLFSGYSSYLILIPDTGVGFFASWTGTPVGGGVAGIGFDEVLGEFLASTLGSRVVSEAPDTKEDENLQRFAGTYWSERRPHRGITVLLSLGSVTRVAATSAGLTINGEGPYRPLGNDVFRYDDGGNRAAKFVSFYVNGDQSVLRHDSSVDYRVSKLSDPAVRKWVVIISYAVCVTGILAIFWPVSATPGVPHLKWIFVGAGLLLLAAPAIASFGFDPGTSLISELMRGDVFRIRAIETAIGVLPLITIVAAWAVWKAWNSKGGERLWAFRFVTVHALVLTTALLTLSLTLLTLDVLWKPM